MGEHPAALGPDTDPERYAREIRFHATVIRGKHRLGLGWNNAGVHLPRWFAGLQDVRYFSNDRPLVLTPPNADPAAKANVADLRSTAARRIYGWAREEDRRYFVAGGGQASAFDAEYDA